MINFYNSFPSLDIHGETRDSSRVLINAFINDCIILKEKQGIIVHGEGEGILKKATQQTLKENKNILSYKIDNFNTGMTIFIIK